MPSSNKNKTLIIIIAVVLFVGAGAYLTVAQVLPAMSRYYVKKAVETGKIEIKRPFDWNKYFIFVSKEEAGELLKKSYEKGEIKYLLPQFRTKGITKLTFQIREVDNPSGAGSKLTYLLVQGLPKQTLFYAAFDGQIRPEIMNAEKPYFQLIGMTPGMMPIMALPCPNKNAKEIILGKFNEWHETELAKPIIRLETDELLDAKIFPGNWQMALIIKKEGDDFTGASFKNLLMKNNKIVMVKI